MKTIYLDNSATTKPSAAVIAAMTDALENGWYNPSALYRPAMDAEKAVENAREICLKAAGAANQRMVFTSGGTEADNIAILGHLRTKHKPGRVLMLSVEHPAVLNCAQEAEHMGHKVVPIPVDRRGVVDLPALEGLLGEDVHLITLMQVNNEVGAVQPIAEVAALRDRFAPNAAIHVDGVQGFLRVPLNFNALKIQSYAFSGHKIHASKGIGGLIFRKDQAVAHRLRRRAGGQPALRHGKRPRHHRAGRGGSHLSAGRGGEDEGAENPPADGLAGGDSHGKAQRPRTG